jgi:hypothetical protein
MKKAGWIAPAGLRRIANRQSVDRHSQIANPSIGNLQSAIGG